MVTLVEQIVSLAEQAGAGALTYYEPDVAVQLKEDRSPLTRADLASHACIVSGLANIDPDTPVISEEGELPSIEERRSWHRFWLVDPLDGTKEFVRGNGEFTVNVALLEDGEPVLGVVFAPALELCFWATAGGGSWRRRGNGNPEPVAVSGRAATEPLIVAESRSHPSPALEAYLDGLTVAGRVQAGSSLKFCWVADGTADVYPRIGPTMEWDVAAGHCIAAEAGASVVGLSYNGPDLRNGSFVVGPEGLHDPIAAGHRA
jgi:3'(2'), 5'-bisphosphate nucleotidase